MKTYQLSIPFFLIFLGTSNVSAQQCQEKFTRYSDNNSSQFSYFGAYKDSLPCSCNVTFHLPDGEGYLDEETRGRVISRTGRLYISNNTEDKNFSQTARYLYQSVSQNKRCPDENEYQTQLKPIFLQEKSAYKQFLDKQISQEEELRKREAQERERELAARRIELQKFCKGAPKINQEIVENVSYVGKVDPQSVRLNRVNMTEDARCIAVFYTPKGVAKAPVGFSASGVINRNGPVEYPR